MYISNSFTLPLSFLFAWLLGSTLAPSTPDDSDIFSQINPIEICEDDCPDKPQWLRGPVLEFQWDFGVPH